MTQSHATPPSTPMFAAHFVRRWYAGVVANVRPSRTTGTAAVLADLAVPAGDARVSQSRIVELPGTLPALVTSTFVCSLVSRCFCSASLNLVTLRCQHLIERVGSLDRQESAAEVDRTPTQRPDLTAAEAGIAGEQDQ